MWYCISIITVKADYLAFVVYVQAYIVGFLFFNWGASKERSTLPTIKLGFLEKSSLFAQSE